MPKKKKASTGKKKFNPLYVYVSIVFLTFLSYGNSLKNQYSLDDNYVIVNKKVVQNGLAGIPKIFTSFYSDSEIERHSYRPITTTSFAIEYQFFGANPFISHLINLLLYALCCILLFRLILHLDQSKKTIYIAWLAALIFFILPIHSEVVNNVKCRDELLCFSFGVLSLIQFLKYTDTSRKKHLIFGILLYLLSILSKTTTITLIALTPFALSYFKNIKIKKLALIIFTFILCYISSKILFKSLVQDKLKLKDLEGFENPLVTDSYTFFDRIPVGFTTVGQYLEMILFPGNLSCYYGYNQVEIADWSSLSTWFSILIIISMITAIVYFHKRYKLITFGLVWFLVSISMFTNIVKPVVGILADRFAFFPSIGIAIALASSLYHLYHSQFFKRLKYGKILLYIITLLIFGFSWNKIIKRNADWYDLKTLYQSDIKNAPKSAKLRNLLASTLFQEIQKNPPRIKRAELVKEAEKNYKAAVAIYPEYGNAWNNLGTLVMNEYRDAKQALSYFEKAIIYQKNSKQALFGAGYACEVLGNYVKALDYYTQVADIEYNFQNVQSRIQIVKGLNK